MSETCTTRTAASNALVVPLKDRMPVIVALEHFARWLDPAYQRIDVPKLLLEP